MPSPLPTLPIIQRMVEVAFPRRSVAGFEVISGGLNNTNLRIHFDNETSVVLRIYRDGAAVCRKEAALHRLVRQTVTVAEVLYAEPDGIDGSNAFAILEYIDGITFQQLKRTNQHEAIAEASYSAGKTLAEIGRYQFSKPGRILLDEDSGELTIGEPFVFEDQPLSTLVDLFLRSEHLRRRISGDLIAELQRFFLSWSELLPNLANESRLVHCDFGNRNLLVKKKQVGWTVAAVLDWELAFSGSPLLDVGHFLRYDYSAPLREPNFSRGFVQHGGYLPDDWQRVVRVVDLTGLVECLTHDHLPEELESEITQLIRATLTDVRL